MLHDVLPWRSFALLFALGSLACSSDDSTAPTTTNAGTTSTGAGQGGAGGATGASTTSTTSAGGTAGGSSTGSTGGAGAVGSGGSSAGGNTGSGGSAGGAGSSGAGGAPSTDGGPGSGGGPADGGPRDAGGTSDATGSFALTSSAITEGGMFPTANTCTGNSVSPPFAWTPGPSGTMSYAIVLTDKSISLRHWVLWDIPPDTMSLPANLPKTATLAMPAGAKQVSIQGGGYAGPCPPTGTHTYEFALYAVNVATLPGVTTNSMPMAVETAVLAHQIAKTTLTAEGMK